MLVLRVPQSVLDADVPKALRQLEDSPQGWSGLARLGMLQRLSGDRAGLDKLSLAAETYLATSRDTRPKRLITPANLFRLAGYDDRSRQLFTRIHTGLKELVRTRGHSDATTGVLVDVCFILGLDAEALETNAALVQADARAMWGLRHPIIADLAKARMVGDAGQAQAVVDWFDEAIKKEGAATSVSGTGQMNLHDWLEIALVTQSELAGEVSLRLREI